jgi:integrase/recombinase XerD
MTTLAQRPHPTKGRKLPGEVLTPAEVSRLIRACGRGPCGIRNAGLIAMMFGTGLRISEALALRPSDLDLPNGMVRVKHGKGDRARPSPSTRARRRTSSGGWRGGRRWA